MLSKTTSPQHASLRNSQQRRISSCSHPKLRCRFLWRTQASTAHVLPPSDAEQILQAATLVTTSCAATAAAQGRVLGRQPMLSDLVTACTGPVETVVWKIALDILLPIACVWGLLRWIDWAAVQARAAIEQRVQGMGDVSAELRRRSTLTALLLLAVRTPCLVVLRPLLLAYTVRTALHIADLVVHKYRLCLPGQFTGVLLRQYSAQLVQWDATLQTLLRVTGVLFTTWFLIQLKDLLIRDLILVRAIKSGRKELERVWTPLSSLMTWSAVLACGISICRSLGFSLEPLLAVGGAGGIAAGFASQQVLINIVSGINIFLTRPFVIGDQVKFAGALLGPDAISGTVEGVEIMRTLLRTTEGTLVAVPNKLVAELVVFNRTRSLTAAPRAEAAAVAAAAPLRRVLCFYIQLDRVLEPLLDEIRAEVQGFLECTTKQQLKQSGFAPDSSLEEDEMAEHVLHDSAQNGNNNGTFTAHNSDSDSSNMNSIENSIDDSSNKISISISINTQELAGVNQQQRSSTPGSGVAAAVAAAVNSAMAAVTGSARSSPTPPAAEAEATDEQKVGRSNPVNGKQHTVSCNSNTAGCSSNYGSSSSSSNNGSSCSSSNSNAPEGEPPVPPAQPEPGALLVGITLSKLTEDQMLLFVRCEMIIPAASMHEAVQRQTEAAIMGVSGLVRDKYGGVLLW